MPPTPPASILSRRAVIGAASAVPALASPTARAGSTLALCQDWLAEEAEIERLLSAWSDLEERGLPNDAIDARLTMLRRRQNARLRRLSTLTAEAPPALAAKLAVATKLIPPEDHPMAHGLLSALLDDMARLWR